MKHTTHRYLSRLFYYYNSIRFIRHDFSGLRLYYRLKQQEQRVRKLHKDGLAFDAWIRWGRCADGRVKMNVCLVK